MVSATNTVGIGIDLGSSAVRVGLYNYEDRTLIKIVSKPVNYYYNPDGNLAENWQYTQRSVEIMNAIDWCFNELKVFQFKVLSCGVSATCSMVISKYDPIQEEIKPYQDNDVVFWMDNTALNETEQINKRCDLTVLKTLGGAFIPEMGAPKLFKFIKNIALRDHHYVIFDLHRFIGFQLMKKYGWFCPDSINQTNSNGVGNDGEIFGWSDKFYKDILELPSNITLGLSDTVSERYIPNDNNTMVKTCIDCYSSWFTTLSFSKGDTLFIVAGTSTCYLYAKDTSLEDKTKDTHINGIWGPFTSILDSNHSVYEAGASCSGKLLEHLFKTHNAASHEISGEIAQIESHLRAWESTNHKSFHWNIKHMFYYGDLDGNRTPLADPQMRGMFIGESTDSSFTDLTKKYLSCLECLAFQTKLLISEFKKLGPIKTLIFTGSQTKNTRLLNLISAINNDIRIFVPTENVDLMGVKGSFLLARSAREEVPILEDESPSTLDQFIKIDFCPDVYQLKDSKLKELLQVKYEIYLDMAKQQQRYRKLVDSFH